MPNVWSLIVDQGILFQRGYVTTPLCCPSRASILTGMYARHHGVRTNDDPLTHPTVVERLHESGYYTGLVGKYLNSWNGSPRPEFDFWAGIPGGGTYYLFPSLNVSGLRTTRIPFGFQTSSRPSRIHPARRPLAILSPTYGHAMTFDGYITDILWDHAFQFLRQAPADRPFFLVFAPNAPHAPAIPAPGDETPYADLPPHRSPSFNEQDVTDKPLWLQGLPLLSPREILDLDQLRLRQLRALKAVDEAVADLLGLLKTQGREDRTCVIFLSDNGIFLGEHRLTRKNAVYEEAARVPFALRYPPLVRRPRVESRLVANIDLAPTIYELAGLPIPPEVDGRSLMPLLQGTSKWRDELLIEGWEPPPFTAIETDRYVYVETAGDRPELYDLALDPYELRNAARDPARAQIRSDLQQLLGRHSNPERDRP